MYEKKTFFSLVNRESTRIFQVIEPDGVRRNEINCTETGSVYIVQDSVFENVTTPV